MLKFLSRLSDSNEREIRRFEPTVALVNALEPEFTALSDAELRAKTEQFRERLRASLGDLLIPIEQRPLTPDEAAESELVVGDPTRVSEERKEQHKRERHQIDAALDEMLPEAFAAVREAMRRALAKRHYDVQLIGGMVLHSGAIAEMKTGEGKTFVAPLAAYLNGLTGRGVHVVTVNDYLAKRDAQWIGQVFWRLGMSVGSIQHEAAFVVDPDFPQTDERLRGLRPVTRAEAYAADVTYGTNNEFGFDYLRDNLVIDLAARVQRGHFFAIVDEVDNILIDEARTPLIISGAAEESADKYIQFARLVPRLQRRGGLHRRREVPAGRDHRGRDRQDGALARGRQPVRQRLLDGAAPRAGAEGRGPLQARQGVRRQGRRGDHRRRVHRPPDAGPALERGAAPGGRGQGGGEDPERVADPRHDHLPELLPHVRQAGRHDRHGRDARRRSSTRSTTSRWSSSPRTARWSATTSPTSSSPARRGSGRRSSDEIVEEHERGRPVLVGTISVEVSEMLSEMLKRRGIKHSVLNAKLHEREAEIVAQAGRSDSVTIATNMAGRGTDIILGGNPEMLAADLLHKRGLTVIDASPDQYAAALAEADRLCAEDRERVVAAGGLHIVGTERHEARRIDNQLRGRAGRQGDPGSTRFYLSLEDDLMRRFASDRVQSIMRTLGFNDETALESRMVSRTIESAQSRVEGFNLDTRKHVVEYDDVINRQRETIYHERERILRSDDLAPTVLAMLGEEVQGLVAEHTGGEFAAEWNVDGLRAQLLAMVPTLDQRELAAIDEMVDREQMAELVGTQVEEAYRAQAGRGRRRGHARARAARAAARHRLAVGGAPHRRRRHATRRSGCGPTASASR